MTPKYYELNITVAANGFLVSKRDRQGTTRDIRIAADADSMAQQIVQMFVEEKLEMSNGTNNT